MRLAIISTHPIQYNAPLFKMLAAEKGIVLKVFYTWSQRQTDFHDEKFGKVVKWDIPLLQGYDFMFVENVSKRPGNGHSGGIVCPELIGAIKAFDPTHLLVYGWNFNAHFRAIRYFKGKVPVLFRGDSTLLDEAGGVKQVLRRLVLRFVYRYVDKALYVGEANRQYYLAHGLKPHQLVHAPHAIDNERFSAWSQEQEQQLQQLRKELQIAGGDRVILFVGKFEPKKDPAILLQAFMQLRQEMPSPDNIKLLYVGNGAMEQTLRDSAEAIPEVLFLPFQNQSQMPVIYRLGSVLCLPSKGPGETWGLVINEANACGVKCVISDRAGCAKDLGEMRGNRVFASGDVGGLVDGLKASVYGDRKSESGSESGRESGRESESGELDREWFLERWNYGKVVEAIKKIGEDE